MPTLFSGWYQSTALGLALLRADGKLYNFSTEGWDAIPDTDMPTAQNILRLAQPITKGPLSNNWFGTLPDVASGTDNIVAIALSLDSSGKPIAQIDQWPAPYLSLSLVGRGGFRSLNL